jgi:phosphatidylglycerol:prolipoprotein diacylglycerol transferase
MIHDLHLTWNPSQGIDLGFFMIRYYSLGWYITKQIFDREGETVEKLDTLFVFTVIGTLLGARLGHVFFYDWEYFKNHPAEILLPFRFSPTFEFTGFAGLASHGAATAVIIAMVYYSKKVIKRPLLWVLDRITLSIASGGVFVRIGNFFNSEIVGKPTESSFGIKFIQDSISEEQAVNLTQIANPKEAFNAIATNPDFAGILNMIPAKHPTQLYEAFGYIIVFAVVYYMYWKTEARTKQGLLFGTFLVLLWSVRFLAEFVKESQGGFESALGVFTTGQWLSIPFILVGFALMGKALAKK